MNTSQYQVAVEFGFSKKLIEKLLKSKKYESAGDLIEELENLELQATEQGHEAEKDQGEAEEKEMEEKIDENKSSSDSAIANVGDDAVTAITKNFKQLTLREETERLYYSSICLVCRKTNRTRIILPCSHLSHCENCNKKVKKCPLPTCGSVVDFTIETFM